jgi:hypothetical protein
VIEFAQTVECQLSLNLDKDIERAADELIANDGAEQLGDDEGGFEVVS